MACLVVVHVRNGSRTEQWRDCDGSSHECHYIQRDVFDSKIYERDYRRVSFKTKEYHVELEQSSKQSVTSGSLFWKRVMQEVHNTVMVKLMYEEDYAKTFDGDERPLVSVKKNWIPAMTWKEDALILHAVPKGELLNGNKTQTLTTFPIDLGVVEKIGFIEQPQGVVGYVLDPYLQFTCPSVTYDNQTYPTDPSNRSDKYWNGEHFAGTQPTDLTRDISDIMYRVKNKRLHPSRMVEWQFNNLNASFEKLVGTSKCTVMVYSDVVESSVVGSGKFPLLREVQLLRTGDGRSTVEPLHHQWTKVRGNQLDIVEVEVATPGGTLAILLPGKTIVTVDSNSYKNENTTLVENTNKAEMRGGSLTRQHTPVVMTQEGEGLAQELMKIAGPLIVQQAQARLQDIQRGQSLADTWSNRGEQLTRGLKRKAPALA